MKRRTSEFAPLLVHTGQHYDPQMSDTFFRGPCPATKPDVHSGGWLGFSRVQTAAVMQRFEPVVLSEKPEWVLVVGDVNSTWPALWFASSWG